MEAKGIDAYVKYNYFHKEQKRKQQTNPFLVKNLYYNEDKDFFVCPMGQHLEYAGKGKRRSSNGYEAQVSYYEARRCEGCPLRTRCHKAAGNRIIEVNHRLRELKAKARALLLSDKGKYHRSKRPVEVEAVFGQMKSNNRFTRFSLRSLAKADIEFGLMALAHNLRKLAAQAQKAGKKGLFNYYFGLYLHVIYIHTDITSSHERKLKQR